MTEAYLDVESEMWRGQALCAQIGDGDLWFPEPGGPTRPARLTCLRCEVRQQCLDEALANNEIDGIWGGMTPSQRKRLKRGHEVRIGFCTNGHDLMIEGLDAKGACRGCRRDQAQRHRDRQSEGKAS